MTLPTDNIQQHSISLPMLVEEVSSTEFYIGHSNNFSSTSYNSWRIKKVSKVGDTWVFGYPSGDQSFSFIWDDRFEYTYSQ